VFRALLALSALAEITRRYHFLDMPTGWRVWRSELSTIDTALALAESWVAESGTLALRLPLSRTIFAKLQLH